MCLVWFHLYYVDTVFAITLKMFYSIYYSILNYKSINEFVKNDNAILRDRGML